MKTTTGAPLGLLASLSLALATPLASEKRDSPSVYGFDKIQTTPDFNWVPCFGKFTCTKLEVPLDYDDVSAGTTHVAFMKWSSNSTAGNSSTQDILLNPGGPGGSGVSFLADNLDLFLQAIGTNYNLIGFDPRSVNNSGPDVSCFPRRNGRTSSYYDPDLFEILDANDTKSYGERFAKASAVGDFCTNVHSAANDTAKYVNTIATATDMLHYTELLAKSKGQDPKKSQLWYYGISYGTVLGTTFAAKFPNRVGRMIVDGVVDGEDYYQGAWKANVVDADAAVRYFFQTCYDAGKGGNCSFWAESPAAIEARYEALLSKLSEHPIPVADLQTPIVVTAAYLKTLTLQAPYNPIGWFPLLADLMTGLEVGNATTVALIAGRGTIADTCKPQYKVADVEPLLFIACNDANGRTNLTTYDSWVDHANLLINQSHFLGEAWATNTAIRCRKMGVRSPQSQVFQGYPGANQTSTPMLFISTKIDPVTPLRAAKKMVARFGGARLLVQDSVGHGSISSISRCTYGYMRKYYEDGSLPDVGTVCQPESTPFKDDAKIASQVHKRSLI